MNINDYSFHDAIILGVREYPEHQKLEIEIDFPVDWENNKFQLRKMMFVDVISYSINTIPFVGHPTILEINELKGSPKIIIEIITNAGKRIIEYRDFELTT
jgi:hypothetical protein